MRKLNTKIFISRSSIIHNNKYDYAKSIYKNSKTPISIICPIHGEFLQKPADHLIGRDCNECARLSANKTQHLNNNNSFIQKSKKIHNNYYDYSKVIYENSKKDVTIICPIHGEFLQKPIFHIQGRGCFKCGVKKASRKKICTYDEYIKRADLVYESKYEYDKQSYTALTGEIVATCKIHGVFNINCSNHLKGQECPECMRAALLVKRSNSFIQRSEDKHKNIYNYENVNYIHANEKVIINCELHGDFPQRPADHVRGSGCPQCVSISSKEEKEIVNYIFSIQPDIILLENKKDIIDKELDIFLPEYDLAIEYCGIFWHSERWSKNKNKHLEKYIQCKEKGIHLLTIYSNEWQGKKEIVKSIISNKLKLSNRIYARKCNIKDINSKTANMFYERYHIQGKTARNVLNIGLFFEDELIACMTFGRHPRNNSITLSRYASKSNTTVVGGASKIIKHAQEEIKCDILSWSDNRWSNGNLYGQLGFEMINELPPSYDYVDKYAREIIPMQKMQKSKIGCPKDIKEHVFLRERGFYRIWNCGRQTWLLPKSFF